MSFVPSRRLVLLALVPVGLALATLADRALVWPMVAFDGLIVVAALFDAWLGRRRLVTVERRCPEVLSVGRPNAITLELRSSSRRDLVVEVTDDLFETAECAELPATAAVKARGVTTVRYHVTPMRRGAYAIGDHNVRYGTPLGLWRRQVRFPARQEIRVYPDVKLVRAWELLARQDREYALVRAARVRGGESEFERLREHRRDDEFRSIDWRATARRQKLIAREYQIERNQSVLFLLDCGRLMTAETGGLSHLDHALNAMLMLSHVAARGGDQVGLIAFDARVSAFLAPQGGPRAGQRIIRESYDLHARLVESDYGAAFDQLALRVRRRALVVLFTQVADERGAAEVAKRMRALRSRHLPLVVLFREAEVGELVEPAGGAQADLDLYRRGAAAEFIAWRERLLRDLKGGGVLVLDVLPKELTAALINRYLEIKSRHLL